MTESEFQRKIIKLFKQRGCLVLNLHGHGMQTAGWPDLYVCHPKLPNSAIWIELKVEKRKVTDLQSKKIKELKDRGVPVVVWRWTKDNEFFLGLFTVGIIEYAYETWEIARLFTKTSI